MSLAVLSFGLVVASAQPAFAAGQTVGGKIVFPASAPANVRKALDPSVSGDSGIYLTLYKDQLGTVEGWQLGADANVSYNPGTGDWSISSVPNGRYRLTINVNLPNNGSAAGTSQIVTVNNANVSIGDTTIAESGRFRGAFGLCGWQSGDDVKHYVKNVASGTAYLLESGQSGWVEPSSLCPPEVSFGNTIVPSSGIPAGNYIAYTVWNGNTHYYAGDDVKASSNEANAQTVTVQNWVGAGLKSLVPAQVAAGEATIAGRAETGQKLTAGTQGWTPGATLTYQWLRSGQPISGATSKTYVLDSGDLGKQISVKVTGSKAGFESVTKTSAKTAKVEKPAYQPPTKTPFKDVATNDKFFAPIAWMYDRNISTGVNTSAGRVFQPKDGVSREAMAAFLYRFKESSYKGPKVSPFSDVQPGDKFYNEIAWMYETGLSTGNKQPGAKPAYAPKDTVTREAMAAFIYRLEAATAQAPVESPFGDMKRGDKFFKEIAWMGNEGLSMGNKQPSGKPFYAPKSTVTREAMAAFLYRLDTRS